MPLNNLIFQMRILKLARVIRILAIFLRHIPGKPISGTGTLRVKVKTSTDIRKDIPGGRITVTNRQALKNKTNGYPSIH
jgi:hypothetical protein